MGFGINSIEIDVEDQEPRAGARHIPQPLEHQGSGIEQPKAPPIEAGDPTGIRTPAATVKGWCPNH